MRRQNKTTSPRGWMSLISNAYRSEDPIAYLITTSTEMSTIITAHNITNMLRYVFVTPTREAHDDQYQRETSDTIAQYQETAKESDTPLSETQLKSIFIHLATSVSHTIGCIHTQDGATSIYLNPRNPLVTYAEPGEPLSYIWFNVEPRSKDPSLNGYLSLVKHTLIDPIASQRDKLKGNLPFKVTTHVAQSTHESRNCRVGFDLKTGIPFASLPHGSFLRMGINLVSGTAHLTHATSAFHCAVLITYGSNYQFQGLYYNCPGKSLEHKKLYTLPLIAHASRSKTGNFSFSSHGVFEDTKDDK